MNTAHHIPLSSSHLLAWQLMRLQQARVNDEPAEQPRQPEPKPDEKPEMPKPTVKPEVPPSPSRPEVKPEVKPEIIQPSQQPEIPVPTNPLPGSSLNFLTIR
ncbi:MAG: hypothetical protein DI628_02075 [Blastochloris viridis]|uniref:Uncharacterized protein n=1 Tax=Blastochloris viridis TaxID=1079 RepID=A0A6N4R8B2_BLAVI|nr:MAG: hypothetical protein DI628_02075 [Blastochloris viridis]